MHRETSLRVHADNDTNDLRARKLVEHPTPHGDVTVQFDQPKRGEVLRQFLALSHQVEFKNYPRLEAAWQDTQTALTDLGFEPAEQDQLMQRLLEETANPETPRTITEQRILAHSEIMTAVEVKLGKLAADDQIRLQPLEQALCSFHIRSLEVLAVFQKQERRHTASHRADSSRDAVGERAFNGPQLSLEAITEALKRGVKTIEIDITALGDGTPVVTHSLSTATTEGKRRIADIPNLEEATSQEATIDTTGANLYSLEELLTALERYKGLANINLEIKDPRSIPKLIELIRDKGLEQDVVVSSYHHAALLEFHQQLPEVRLGVNTTVAETNIGNMLQPEASTSAVPSEQNWVKGFYYQNGLPEPLQTALRETGGYLSVTMPTFKVTTLALKWINQARRAAGVTSVIGKGLEQFAQLITKLADPMVKQMADLKHRADQQGINLLMFRVSSEQAAIIRNEIDDLHLDAGEDLTYPRMANQTVTKSVE